MSARFDLSTEEFSYYDEFMKRIVQGHEVAESQVDEWVAEAEAGYDVEQLRTRWGRTPRGASAAQVIPVRLTDHELAAVMARAEREGLNRSEAIRAALDAWAHVA
jgi:predicted DNA binding CopG/RHH family protein